MRRPPSPCRPTTWRPPSARSPRRSDGMFRFIGRRLLACVVLVVVIAGITFLLAFSGTGNVARNLLGENATPDQLAAKNAELGLDKPLLAQLGTWASHALHGDLGISWFTNEPVAQAIANR